MKKPIDIQGLEKFTVHEIVACNYQKLVSHPERFTSQQFSEAVADLTKIKERLYQAHIEVGTSIADMMDSDGLQTADHYLYSVSAASINHKVEA